MSNQNNSTEWIKLIQENTPSKGTFYACDKANNHVIIEWHKTTMMSSDFARAMKNVSEMGIQAFTSVEMQFLKSFPEVVGQEPYFKPFEPLFSNGFENIDWKAAQTITQSILYSHFIFDPSLLNEEIRQKFVQDVVFFVSIKDITTRIILGFIVFLIKPAFTHANIKVINIAIAPESQNRGLAKIAMSSIFKIVPEVARIFLCTRVTNEQALRAYRSWGFTHDLNPTQDPHYTFNLKHWKFMEYSTHQSDNLQRIANTFSQQV